MPKKIPKTTLPEKSRVRRPHRRDLLRWRKFAEAYLAVGQRTYFNAERSALAAGYTKKTAHGFGYKLLDNWGVQEEMRRLREKRAAQSTICSATEVLEVLSQQVRTTPDELVDEKGFLVPIKRGEKDRAAAVAGFKETVRTIASGEDVITERKLEYKLVDRQKAAEIIGRHHGIFQKDNEQSKPDAPVVQLVNAPPPMTLDEWTRQVQAIQAKAQPAPQEAAA